MSITVTLHYQKQLDEPEIRQSFGRTVTVREKEQAVNVELTPDQADIWNQYGKRVSPSNRYAAAPVKRTTSRPVPQVADTIIYDSELTPAEAWQAFVTAVESYQAAIDEMDARQDALRAEKEAEKKRRAKKRQERLAAVTRPDFSNGTAVVDLRDNLFFMCEQWYNAEFDSRFKQWAKEVTAINPGRDNGYMFKGQFLPAGTVEMTPEPAVYLIAATAGSRKNNHTEYYVITFDGTEFHRTGIHTDDRRGWALRLRDEIQACIAGQTADPFAELRQAADNAAGDTVTVDTALLRQALDKL